MLLRLTGRAAWYLPAWLDRILPDIRFGHGAGPAVEEESETREPVSV